MKNRQFITILALVLVGFIYLGYRVDTLERVVRNVDENVATVDGRLVWDVAPKVRDIEDYSLQTLEIVTDTLWE